MSPKSALHRLKTGNDAYVSGVSNDSLLNCSVKRADLAKNGQNPFAVIVTCADSRVPAEAIFQTELGDLFVIRVAGCCVDSSVIASIEYAISQFQCHVCIVMGHSQCGAILAALKVVEENSDLPSENIAKMLAPLTEAIAQEVQYSRIETNHAKLERVTKMASVHQINRLKSESPLISKKSSDGQLELISATYDIHTGNVAFEMGAH